jgi:hypothetical protein
MKPFYKYISIFCLLLPGCTNPKAKTGKEQASMYTKLINDYRRVPQYIRSYLDSSEGGNFLIANPGEPWAAGCTRLNKEPNRQFISATISVDTFKMRFWQGGIAKMERSIVLLVKNEKVQATYGDLSIEVAITNTEDAYNMGVSKPKEHIMLLLRKALFVNINAKEQSAYIGY